MITKNKENDISNTRKARNKETKKRKANKDKAPALWCRDKCRYRIWNDK